MWQKKAKGTKSPHALTYMTSSIMKQQSFGNSTDSDDIKSRKIANALKIFTSKHRGSSKLNFNKTHCDVTTVIYMKSG